MKGKKWQIILKSQNPSLLFWFSGSRAQEKHETSKPTVICRKTSPEICVTQGSKKYILKPGIFKD